MHMWHNAASRNKVHDHTIPMDSVIPTERKGARVDSGPHSEAERRNGERAREYRGPRRARVLVLRPVGWK